MKHPNSLITILIICLYACKGTQQGEMISVASSTNSYQLVQAWPSLPADYILGNPVGIGIDTAQNIVVFHRADREWPLLGSMPTSFITKKTIIVLDKQTGKLLHSWGDSLFIMPHGLTVDHQNNIWVTDVGLHQVFKFTHEGQLLLKLGIAQRPGNDSLHFNRPTDIAVAPDGSFYVSDGYRNSRVVKFNAAGQYLFEWGKAGNGPGEFDIPHAIDLDNKGHVYVADRENSRVQVFDSTGKFIVQYDNHKGGKVYSVTVDKINEQLIAADYITNYVTPKGSDIILIDSTGNRLQQFGRSGHYTGPVTRLHDIAIDKEGNIYACDILKNRIQKFTTVSASAQANRHTTSGKNE
jgi:peptidylamidoglycolate lyase